MAATPVDWTKLTAAAKAAAAAAHCPYSDFRVGAALLDDGGRVFAGCNVENVSYGLTICAERNAAFQMVAAGGARRIKALVVYTPTPTPTPPCGACRQVVAEFAASEAPVRSVCDGPATIETTMGALLPHAFDRAALAAGTP
jgi:cytidine deaminase